MNFIKFIAGKVIFWAVGIPALGLAVAIYQMDASTRAMLLNGAGKILAWLGVMLAVPWATFFLSGWVARFENNLAGGALVVLYTAIEAMLLAWLFDWQIHGATRWTFLAAATLLAGVYNLLACDWIAEKVAA